MKKVKEALSTGLFKWNKDYLKAIMNLEEAATNYKGCKKYKDGYKKAL